jgi:tetratricopeptide (TPR) repeat protein
MREPVKPQRIKVEIEKALGYEKVGNIESALKVLTDLCEEYPGDGEVWLEHALLLDKHGKEEEAISKYLNAVEFGLTAERERVALICLASSYRKVDEIDKAMSTILKVRNRFPNAVVECFYALILHDAGFSSKAITALGLTLIQEASSGALSGFEEALKNKFVELS